DRLVDEPADVAGDDPERRADRERTGDRGEADEEREPAAVDQAGQHVAAELVAAERIIGRADRLEAPDHAALVRIGEAEPGREQGCQHDDKQHNRAAGADRIAREPAPDIRPIAARLVDRGKPRKIGDRDAHAQPRLIRGSIAACTTSTMRLSMTKNSASTRIVPWSSGRSRWKIAELSRKPVPGQENTVSMRIEPPSR